MFVKVKVVAPIMFVNKILKWETKDVVLTPPALIPDEEKKLLKFLFSNFFVVPQKVL